MLELAIELTEHRIENLLFIMYDEFGTDELDHCYKEKRQELENQLQQLKDFKW